MSVEAPSELSSTADLPVKATSTKAGLSSIRGHRLVRGAFAGALKKKLLTVTSDNVEGVGRVYRIGPDR